MKIATLSLFALLLGINLFSQSPNNLIKTYERKIIADIEPEDENVQVQYQKDMRVIVWKVPTNESFKYSKENLYNSGYESINSNSRSRIFRNCPNNIVIEISENYGFLTISMQWYSENVKGSIGNLMYCK